MAKRKTIGVNPLDPLVPDLTTPQTGESPAAVNTGSAGPAKVIMRGPTHRREASGKDSKASSPAPQAAQPPSPADLVNRIQSLEKENEFIKWLVGGAILLAIML